MAWVSVAVGGASVLSNFFGARDQRNAQNQALNAAQQAQLGNAVASGAGGARSFSSADGDIGYTLGNLSGGQRESALLSEFGGISARNALVNGVPNEVLQASRNLDQLPLSLGSFLSGEGGASNLAGLSLRQAFDPSRTSDSVASRALSTLRQQAAPQEQQALQSFTQSLYGSGRGAVTGAVGNESSLGGGRLAAAFAQGLSRADLERQLTAQDYGFRAAQNEESLLQSAFSRFGDTSRLAADFNISSYGRVQDALQGRLTRATGLQTLPATIASAFQGVANNATSAGLNFGAYGINLSRLALDQNVQRSNAANQVAGQIGGVVTSNNFSANPVADAFGAFTQPAVDAALTGLQGRFPNAPIINN